MRTFFVAVAAFLLHTLAAAANPLLTSRHWSVNGVRREALISLPPDAKGSGLPLVLAFHGHGGSSRQAASSFRLHQLWPEAIVVYMQGLPTPGKLTDREGKRAGWQSNPGEQNDRDLTFVDTVLASLMKEYTIDSRRVYATGHSNGGSFTYLLLAARGAKFAAVAPSGSLPTRKTGLLVAKPILHIAGEKDDLVKYRWQTIALRRVRSAFDCGEAPTSSSPTNDFRFDRYECARSTLTLASYDGSHKFPESASPLIVAFFKSHVSK